jgi:hypothetical protein
MRTPDKAKTVANKIGNVVLGCIVFGVSFYFIFWGLGQIWFKFRSPGWPHVTGTIVKSEIHVRRTKGTSHFPSIVYKYKVNGVEYENNTIVFGQNGSGRKDEAREAVALYSVGKRVPVYYNPVFPRTACLQPG